MANDLITRFEYELAEAPCGPGSGRYGVRIALFEDLSPAMPYLNSVLKDTQYDAENSILIGRDEQRQYALRANEIRVAGVDDALQAREVVRRTIDMVNRVWRERATIKPSLVARKQPTVMDIYQRLPRTNCRKCGCVTCLAFASDLRAGRRVPADCPPLIAPGSAGELEALKQLFGGQ